MDLCLRRWTGRASWVQRVARFGGSITRASGRAHVRGTDTALKEKMSDVATQLAKSNTALNELLGTPGVNLCIPTSRTGQAQPLARVMDPPKCAILRPRGRPVQRREQRSNKLVRIAHNNRSQNKRHSQGKCSQEYPQLQEPRTGLFTSFVRVLAARGRYSSLHFRRMHLSSSWCYLCERCYIRPCLRSRTGRPLGPRGARFRGSITRASGRACLVRLVGETDTQCPEELLNSAPILLLSASCVAKRGIYSHSVASVPRTYRASRVGIFVEVPCAVIFAVLFWHTITYLVE